MLLVPAVLATVMVSMIGPEAADAPAPSAIEALLDATAAQVGAPLREEGKGYSYFTYGTRDLLYAVGDLDGDGTPEIAARAVYFMGVGSYDLVDVFADGGDGYRRVDTLNLYHLGLEDEVAGLEIRDGVLHIATVGSVRGRVVRKQGAIEWHGPGSAAAASTTAPASSP